jgi:hypothetical protein
MPAGTPPVQYRVQLRHQKLSAGTLLWRTISEYRLDSLFRDDIPDVHNDGRYGGRFDPIQRCRYPYVYLGLDPVTAVAETLLRNAPFQAAGRVIPRVKYERKVMAILETTRPLELIRLIDAEDLAAARQDSWIVHAEVGEYPLTRSWAHWYRDCSVRADGLIWPSKRHPAGQVMMLFGDPSRCADAITLSPFGIRKLGDEPGRKWLGGLLEPLLTYLEQPEEPPG